MSLLCGISLFFVNPVYSQQSEKDIEKANKEFIKQFKKANNIKSVSVKMNPNGYWFYSIYSNKKFGVANSEGKIIIPPIHDSPLEYYPAVEEGYKKTRNGEMWCVETQPVFISKDIEAKKKGGISYFTTIYNIDGNVIMPTTRFGYISVNNSYLEVKEADKGFVSAANGLYTLDGKIILPTSYTFLNFDGKIIYTHKKINDSYYNGAVNLDNIADSVPCIFNSVKYDEAKKKFLVVDNNNFIKNEEYNPNKIYVNSIQDDGVRYYLAKEYDKVIDYYSKKGVDKPWAKFYSGMSMIQKATPMNTNLSSFIVIYDKGELDKIIDKTYANYSWRQHYSRLNMDINLIKQLYASGKTLLEAYLDTDSTFIDEAKENISSAQILLNGIKNTEEEYTAKLVAFYKENAAIQAEKERIERERQTRQNEIYSAIISGLLSGLTNAIQTPSRSNSSSSSHSVPATSSYSSSRSTSSQSSNSSSQLPSNKTTKRLEKCRACQGKGFWVDERISGDLKWCEKCGKMRKPHTHTTCGSCNGKGYK